MSSLPESVRNALVDHLLGTSTYTPPVQFYLALYNGDPAGGGTEVTTPGTNGYNRQLLTVFAASGGAAKSDADIVFGPVSTVAWSNVTYVATFDAASGGNLMWADPVIEWVLPLGSTYTIQAGKYRVRIV